MARALAMGYVLFSKAELSTGRFHQLFELSSNSKKGALAVPEPFP